MSGILDQLFYTTPSQNDTGDDTNDAAQPPNPANSETPVNGGGSISAGGHASSQGSQETPAAVSATTASVSPGNAQNPESTDSVNDEVNGSTQQNASTAAVPQNEGDNSLQSPSSVPVQETEEENGDTSTAEQTAQQEETDNCSHEQLLVSKVIRGQKAILDKLVANLDRTSHRIIKTWEHLACTDEINAPLEIRLKCKLNSENSCTVMLFEKLSSDVEYEHKKVKDLLGALKEIGRNDVIGIITESGGANDQEKISDFVASNAKLIEEIATYLDQKSRVNKNWFELGAQFKIPPKRLKEIEYGQSNPTLALMEYLYSKKPDLTIGTFFDVVVEKLRRNDVKRILSPIISAKGRDTKMEEAIDLESDDMRDICVCLNNPKQQKRWIHVAHELGLPRDEYKDLEPEKPEGATISLFTWIFSKRTDLNVGQLCKALEKIGRNDLVIAVEEHVRQYQITQQHSTTVTNCDNINL